MQCLPGVFLTGQTLSLSALWLKAYQVLVPAVTPTLKAQLTPALRREARSTLSQAAGVSSSSNPTPTRPPPSGSP